MSDLNDNIQRIAKTKELQELVEQLIKKSGLIGKKNPISGARSVSYQTANGGVSNKRSSPGTTETDNPGSGRPEDNNEDGSGNDDGGGDLGDPQNSDKDSRDLQDLLENGAKLGEKISSLTGLTNCGGGKEAIVYMDGDFRPVDFDGLDNYGANEDPRNRDFTPGTSYSVGGFTGESPYIAFKKWIQGGAFPGGVITSVDILIGCYIPEPGSLEACVNVNSTSCTIGDAGCPAEAPFNQFPSDGIQQIAFDGGQFNTSEYENDADINGPWGQNNGSGGPSKITGCTSGGETVEIKALGNGNSQVTLGNGDAYVLDSDGVVTEVL